MTAIDIGPGAINRDHYFQIIVTCIDLANPANEDGSLDTIYIYMYIAGQNVKCGTFYGSGSSWTSRDYQTLGSVASGSVQTFSGLDVAVEAGDIIGVYGSSGYIETAYKGGSGIIYCAGDQFGTGPQTYYVLDSDAALSLYGTGSTPISWGGTWGG